MENVMIKLHNTLHLLKYTYHGIPIANATAQ